MKKHGKVVFIAEDGWEVKLPTTNCCGEVSIPKIAIGEIVQSKIASLMKAYPTTEWMGYLVGNRDKDEILVTDLIIPEQTVSSSDCNSKENEPDSSIGMIHSHHTLGAFFSITDEKGINSNNDLSIVVSNKGDSLTYLACIRILTPCNKYTYVETSKITLCTPSTDDAWLESAKSKISKELNVIRSYVGHRPYYSNGYGGYYGGYYDGYYDDDTADIVDTKFKDTTEEITTNTAEDFVNIPGLRIEPCPNCSGIGCDTCNLYGFVYVKC